MGTALRLAILLGRQRHQLFERVRDRWLARAEVELADRHLVVIAEAALQGVQVPRIERSCEGRLAVIAKNP